MTPTLTILALIAFAVILIAKSKVQALIGKLLLLAIVALIILKLTGVLTGNVM